MLGVMNKRAVAGFLAAALFAAVAGVVLSPGLTSGDVVTMLGLVPIFFVWSGVATGLLGVPAFLLLNYFGLVRWWSATGAGLLIGAIVAIVFNLPNTVELQGLWVMALVGAIAALTFWLIWRPSHAA